MLADGAVVLMSTHEHMIVQVQKITTFLERAGLLANQVHEPRNKTAVPS